MELLAAPGVSAFLELVFTALDRSHRWRIVESGLIL